ncbi:MAG: hypothetical protein M3R17_00700 [Bacteroidota bacterium]|nr:hypothetical protein [Bacteroidota bacterium]
MKIQLRVIIFAVFLLVSCSGKPEQAENFQNDKIIQTFGKSVTTDIGTSGFVIDLPSTHTLSEQKGHDFIVYYITSKDTTYNKGGAGIYFGSAPDQHSPPSMISKNEISGITFGKPSKTVVYMTPTYTWNETVVDESEKEKTQFWFYATSLVELSNLEQMFNTMKRK